VLPLRAALASLVLACAPAQSEPEDVGAAELVDLDPAPDRVRVVLVADEGTTDYLPGKPADVWGYRDGSVADSEVRVPGPILRAPLGASIEIELRNELPVDTTIHWHGVRVPADQDGTSTSQIAVAPGETFTYRFDAGDAGTFWYHPHVGADVQIERGLYGALIVDGSESLDVTTERVLVLDDVMMHCHILEHAERGMMAMLHVMP
jgi:FtsP/CotA-like multicopper oxidase with cupredoxin domain